MIEITSKPKNGKSLIDKRDLFINDVPFDELSIKEKRDIWKTLSKHIELRLINNKSLSKDNDAPYYFEDLLQNITINMGKCKTIVIDDKNKKINYYIRLYSFWDDIKFFFKDLFEREKKNGGRV